jgi:hypothetical protein
MPGTSTPISPTQLRAALKKFGCKVRYIDGWETRNRGDRGDGWGPVYGFVVHHTGDDAADSIDRQVIINGRSDLPGPLAQFGLNDDGTVDVIGWGRANHAGPGDPDVLRAVMYENYGSYPPKPDQKITDGNARFWGVETYYSGGHKPVQYDAMVNLAAAICDAQGWTGKSVIGHKEWNYNKPDPGFVDMARFRADVDARIKAVNAPKPPIDGGDFMATMSDAEKKRLLDAADRIMGRDVQRYKSSDGKTVDEKRDTGDTPVRSSDVEDVVNARNVITGEIDTLAKQVKALTDAVTALTKPPA